MTVFDGYCAPQSQMLQAIAFREVGGIIGPIHLPPVSGGLSTAEPILSSIKNLVGDDRSSKIQWLGGQ
jgi:hypothetical protein